MGPLPKRKISTRRQGKRRAAKKVKAPKLVPCPSCGQPKIPHQACSNCGAYSQRK